MDQGENRTNLTNRPGAYTSGMGAAANHESMTTTTTCCDYMDPRSVYGIYVTRTQTPHAIGLHGIPETARFKTMRPAPSNATGKYIDIL
jgi:hypothetical protein